MASEIEDIIKEQETTNTNLQLLEDSKDINELLLLESKLSNDLLETNSGIVNSLSKDITNSIKVLDSAVSGLKLENVEPEAPVINVASSVIGTPDVNIEGTSNLPAPIVNVDGASSVPTLLNEGESTREIRDVTPIQNLPTIQQEDSPLVLPEGDTSSDSLEGLEDETKEQTPFLASMASNMALLAENAKDRALSLLSVDRQKDPDTASGGLAGLTGKIGPAIAKAGIIGLAAVATGTLVKSLFDGLTDESLIKDITGKASKDLLASEQSFAAISNAVEKLTFGLFSAKEVFEFIQPVAKKFQDGVDALFDPESGVFAEFTTGIIKLFDGDIRGALKDTGELILNLPIKLFELGRKIGDEIASLLPDSFTEGFRDLVDPILDPVFEFIGITIPEAFQEGVNTVIAGFDFLLELPAKIGEAVSGFASDVVDGLLNKVTELSSDLPFGVGDSLKNLFSDDEDKKVINNQTDSNLHKSSEVRAVTPAEQNRAKLLSPIIPKNDGINIASPISPVNKSADKVTLLSKQRLEDSKVTVSPTPPQTIIVPQEKREPKKISRRKESNDMTLAFMGIGSF